MSLPVQVVLRVISLTIVQAFNKQRVAKDKKDKKADLLADTRCRIVSFLAAPASFKDPLRTLSVDQLSELRDTDLMDHAFQVFTTDNFEGSLRLADGSSIYMLQCINEFANHSTTHEGASIRRRLKERVNAHSMLSLKSKDIRLCIKTIRLTLLSMTTFLAIVSWILVMNNLHQLNASCIQQWRELLSAKSKLVTRVDVSIVRTGLRNFGPLKNDGFETICFVKLIIDNFNFDVKRTCTTGKCRDPTLRGDVERHRVCDKHIIRWRSHHPQ